MRHSSLAEVQCDAKVLGPSSDVDGESSYMWVWPQQQRPHFKFCQCCFCVHWLRHCTTGLFGVKRYGVHVNGYTVSDSGEVSMWLARRSATKQTYPGLLDNVVSTDCIWHFADNRSCWHCSHGCTHSGWDDVVLVCPKCHIAEKKGIWLFIASYPDRLAAEKIVDSNSSTVCTCV